MKIRRPFLIKGHGTAFPEQKVVSADLEKKLGLSPGWSEQYSGVRERYHAGTETSAQLGAAAAKEALKQAGLELQDIGLIISAAATFDRLLPHQSALLKSVLDPRDLHRTMTLDINTSCLSFVTALDVASGYLNDSDCRNILIVSAEIASKGLNPKDPKTATLFGDAAAAVIISYDADATQGSLKFLQKTYSSGVEGATIPGGGNQYYFTKYPFDPDLLYFRMESKALLRMALIHLKPFMEDFFSDLPIDLQDLDLFIPHQASKTGLSAFANHFTIEENKIFRNLATQGNCIAASIPTALSQALSQGRTKSGDTIMLAGTSAGFGIGAILLKV